jgi:hypothetical protein
MIVRALRGDPLGSGIFVEAMEDARSFAVFIVQSEHDERS